MIYERGKLIPEYKYCQAHNNVIFCEPDSDYTGEKQIEVVKKHDFIDRFGSNPIFPIDNNSFLILAEYIPKDLSEKDCSVPFGTMTVAHMKRDNENEKYYVYNYYTFGHENWSSQYPNDNNYDICWDYNYSYNFPVFNLDLLEDNIADPYTVLNLYKSKYFKYIEDLIKYYEHIEALDRFEKCPKYFKLIYRYEDYIKNKNMFDDMYIFKHGTLYDSFSGDNFVLYVTPPKWNFSIGNIANSHWKRSYMNEVGLLKYSVNKNKYNANKQLSKYLRYHSKKYLGEMQNIIDLREIYVPLSRLIKYHFPSLNTGDKKQDEKNLSKYLRHFVEKEFSEDRRH